MNNKSSLIVSIIAIILAIVALVFALTGKTKEKQPATAAQTPSQLNIAFINVDTLLNNYDLYNSLMIQFMQKQQKYEKELNSKMMSLQQRSMKLQNDYNKGLITSMTFQQKMQQLQNEQQSIQQWYNEKSQELANDQVMITNRVMDSIHAVINDFNKDGKYQYILVNSALLYGDPGLNITDTIVSLLNERANITK